MTTASSLCTRTSCWPRCSTLWLAVETRSRATPCWRVMRSEQDMGLGSLQRRSLLRLQTALALPQALSLLTGLRRLHLGGGRCMGNGHVGSWQACRHQNLHYAAAIIFFIELPFLVHVPSGQLKASIFGIQIVNGKHQALSPFQIASILLHHTHTVAWVAAQQSLEGPFCASSQQGASSRKR